MTVLQTEGSSLEIQRLPPEAWQAQLRQAQQPALGGWGYGMADEAQGLVALPPALLAGSAARCDAWAVRPGATSGATTSAVQTGQTGCIRWRHNGHWLQGAADLPAGQADLQPLAHRIYRDLFAALAETGYAHLQRVWNYLPHINVHAQGLERYRQFNMGRQQAFLDSGQDAFEGAPAACALGVHSDELCLRFLAAKVAPRPIENPRQTPAYRYPSTYGPRAPTFSRAALSDLGQGQLALWVSGTASIVGYSSLHEGDVVAQTRETIANLQALLGAAGAACGGRFELADLVSCVYVRHPADQPRVQAELDRAWGAQSAAAAQAVYVQADVCRAELLVEVEGHLLAPGQLASGSGSAAATIGAPPKLSVKVNSTEM